MARRDIEPISKGTLDKYLGQRRGRALSYQEYQAVLHLLQNPGTQEGVSILYSITHENREFVNVVVAGARKYVKRYRRSV